MTRLAIWRAESLLGRELKDTLATRRDLWDDLRLLGPEGSDTSTVSEIDGEAALILPGTEDNLGDIDLLFLCTESGEDIEIPKGVSAETVTIVVSENEPPHGYPSVVAGLTGADAESGGGSPVLVSAHPGAVALAHMLEPLIELGLTSCTASLILPSSVQGQVGIDGLLNQTRSILAFQPLPEDAPFDFQLAFNVVHSPDTGRRIAKTVQDVLGRKDLSVAAQASLGGVFHALTVDAHVRLSPEVQVEALRAALEESKIIEVVGRPDALGPIDAAGSILLKMGQIEEAGSDGEFWLRAVMDNLTAGGALNAIGIAEAVLALRPADRYTM